MNNLNTNLTQTEELQLNQREIYKLLAISPIDGRYYKYTSILRNYFSEYAFIKYRLYIEIEYLIFLLENKRVLQSINLEDIFNKYSLTEIFRIIKNIYINFNPEECLKIKEIEKKTNHDVKSIEYYIKNKLLEYKLDNLVPFIHFGLTSQDINNTATPLSLKYFINDKYNKILESIIKKLTQKSYNWGSIVMITKTHGQPATPSTLGKEFKVFAYRLEQQMTLLVNTKFWGKFGGATGNLNAHLVAYPFINWVNFSNSFINYLGLERVKHTTQIDNYENLSTIFDNIKRINLILIDLCRDIWLYISMNYLKLKIYKNEIGSSTMPHKVNPINFENAEGNLLFANSILEFLSRKLPISRLQRDLTDSTVLRNLGVVFGHIVIAYQNILIGLDKIEANKEEIKKVLLDNRIVIAEGIQTVLRRYNYPNAYEKVKEFTRKNKKFTRKDFDEFIESLDCTNKVKQILKNISVENYIGFVC